MLRNLFTYGLILTLLISITGISITWHFCRTLNVVNTEECGMEDMASKKVSSGCCEKDDAKVTISSYMPVCCEIEVVENKVSDQFLFDNYETNKNNNFSVILISFKVGLEFNLLQHSDFALHNTSPPHVVNDIYLQNSVLLI